MDLEVIGLDHIYLSVSDMARSEAFYDQVMKVLDFRKTSRPIGSEPHIHYFNRSLRLTIRPAAIGFLHHQNAPGLHHLCFQVPDRAAVDLAAKLLSECGVNTSVPRLYPEYTEDYYAIFFRDPDGIELEIVNRFNARNEIVQNWHNYPPIGA